MLLQTRKVAYKDQATFSLVFWPFSMKLLWAPIVDTAYFSRFGRRKSWLVPVQYLIGIFMIVLSTVSEVYWVEICLSLSLSFSGVCEIKGPDALGKFLFILRKNLSSIPWDKCVRWFLDLPNFVKAYQTLKTPSSCLGARQIFVRREIWQICQFTRHDLKENINQENFISIFSRSSSAKIKFIFARQSNDKHGRFVPRYAPWRSVHTVQLLRFPSLR